MTMSLAETIVKWSSRLPPDRVFEAFAGDRVVIDIIDDGTVTFSAQGARLLVSEGVPESYTARASISRADLIKGIDGTLDFAGMFIRDFKNILKPTKGEVRVYGGSFMLLGPAVDALARWYKEDPSFKQAIDSCR